MSIQIGEKFYTLSQLFWRCEHAWKIAAGDSYYLDEGDDLQKTKEFLAQFDSSDDIDVSLALKAISAFELRLKEASERKARIGKHTRRIRDGVRQNYAELFVYIGKRSGFRCANCGSTEQLTIDHILPVSLGGDNQPDNLQLLCTPCNCRKGARFDG